MRFFKFHLASFIGLSKLSEKITPSYRFQLAWGLMTHLIKRSRLLPKCLLSACRKQERMRILELLRIQVSIFLLFSYITGITYSSGCCPIKNYFVCTLFWSVKKCLRCLNVYNFRSILPISTKRRGVFLKLSGTFSFS